MICTNIRRLTARERAERDEHKAAQYDRIYSDIEQAERDYDIVIGISD